MLGMSSIHSLIRGAARLARALLVASALTLALGLAGLRAANARAGEALIDFGREFSNVVGTRPYLARRLTVNNVELRFASGSAPLDLRETMAKMHAWCRTQSGISSAPAARALANVLSPRDAGLLDGVYRYETKNAGVVACIDTGGNLMLDDLTARLRRFAKTGNLASLGQLRYALLRRSQRSTTVLLLWTEGPVSFFDMFPKMGDAPGTDPPGLPRPNNSRRLLSAAEQGQQSAITVYAVERDTPSQLREWYKRALSARGWTLVATAGGSGWLARHRDRIVEVLLTAGSKGQTTITLAELS
jgi:hypothetical protein